MENICRGPKPDEGNDSIKARNSLKKLKHVEGVGASDASYTALTEIYRNEMADLDLFDHDWN